MLTFRLMGHIVLPVQTHLSFEKSHTPWLIYAKKPMLEVKRLTKYLDLERLIYDYSFMNKNNNKKKSSAETKDTRTQR